MRPRTYCSCQVTALERGRAVIDAFPISLLASLHRHGQLFLLATDRFLTAIDQIGGRFTNLSPAAPDELFALIRLGTQEFGSLVRLRAEYLPRLFTRPGSHEHSNRNPHTQTDDEVSDTAILFGHLSCSPTLDYTAGKPQLRYNLR